MALVTPDTRSYVKNTTTPKNKHWTHIYGIGTDVPVSGIYRCTGCGDEITSNKGDIFPPQNKTQHECQNKAVMWELVVMTQTKGPNK
ncbi:protein L [Pseudomonas sp. R62]|uniref:protein L n=1 Tax=Pseudomonas sp. R62 TaxID=1144884 RepID=UPI0009DAEC92|nr:protein L [Pseudomonas sp. R62]